MAGQQIVLRMDIKGRLQRRLKVFWISFHVSYVNLYFEYIFVGMGGLHADL